MKNLSGSPSQWFLTEETVKKKPHTIKEKKEKPKPPLNVKPELVNLHEIRNKLKQNYEHHPDKHLSDTLVNLDAAQRSLEELVTVDI